MRSIERVFSGIQPTGIPHLGNFFGALSKWVELAKNDQVKPIYSVVDVHAYSSKKVQFGRQLYENILDATASLLALGLNSRNCILFRQSDILEHNYLANVLDNFISTQRLARMTQYKEKSKNAKSLPNGLLTYPVLQTADILLYRANLVPVGEDQTQHIELARDIARNFNIKTQSQFFPEPRSLLNGSEHARRIKSLRDPSKKMSKSDPDKKSFIEIVDEPDVLLEKIKKAMTDNESRVYYDAENRPGVSNLMRIHHLATGETFDQIRDNFAGVESSQYKLKLADMLIEKFKPIREEYKRVRNDRVYLEEELKLGHDQAKPIAVDTVLNVKCLLGSIYHHNCSNKDILL